METDPSASTSQRQSAPDPSAGTLHVALAGIVCALVGWTSSFAVVLTGLRAVGADPAQAASGLTVVSLTMGVGCVLFSWWWRMPITMAWSTPGAALLASSAAPSTGFSGAVTAFIGAGLLIALCGLIRPLGRLVAAIPTTLANAMLAGVLMVLCLVPVHTLIADPTAAAPVIVVWLLCLKFAPRWAVPAALLAAVAVMVVVGSFTGFALPTSIPLSIVGPSWDPAALVALGLPLFLVTMTSQNIAGMAVLASFGYHPRLGPLLSYSGAATAGGALFGGHAINLAAISAALAAGPEAHRDPSRRWVAGVACGVTYIGFGLASAPVAALAQAAPEGLIASVAGLALIGTFAAAGGAALADEAHRVPAAVCFLVAASGIAVWGVGGAFWGLVAGGVAWVLLTRRSA